MLRCGELDVFVRGNDRKRKKVRERCVGSGGEEKEKKKKKKTAPTHSKFLKLFEHC